MRHSKCWREAERCCDEVRFETRRSIKMRLRRPKPRLGSLQLSPDSLLDFGEGNTEGGIERAREVKGMEGEGKERRERDRGNGN